MKPEFWQDRWEKDHIHWQQKTANPHLVKYWPSLNLAQGSTVFVPLCGKSLDMQWLDDQGYKVMGVELAEKGCQQYFELIGREPEVVKSPNGTFSIYRAGNTEIWCGDLFDLEPEDVKNVSAVYDRASVIALPPDMRERYASHLGELLENPQGGLIITLDYDQSKMKGPPHAVSDTEARRLFGKWKLAVLEEIDKSDRFKEEGIEPVERVYAINSR